MHYKFILEILINEEITTVLYLVIQYLHGHIYKALLKQNLI